MPPVLQPVQQAILRRSILSVMLSQKLLTFGAMSLILSSVVILRAWNINACNFYPTLVHLSRSNSSMMALMSNMFFIMLLLAKFLQHFTFGELRTVELDHLYERSWLTVTEMLIAMTIFRDGMYLRFTFFFALMLFLKVFHWISADRVDYMEHTPNRPRREAFFLVGFMIFLLVSDLCVVALCCSHVIEHGKSVMILFGFEFIIMTAGIIVTMLRNAINAYHNSQGQLWENRSLFTFYLDLIYDLFKLTFFLAFFIAITALYRFPLHIIRDFYLTLRSFLLRMRDLIRYRRATSNMDTRYPNATILELTRFSDRTCIICREDMFADNEPGAITENNPVQARSQVPKRLPCNHIFHFGCLRSWLERQQSCPTCRRSVLETIENNNPPQRQEQIPLPQENQNEQADNHDNSRQVLPTTSVDQPSRDSLPGCLIEGSSSTTDTFENSGIDSKRLEILLQRCLGAAFAMIPPPPPPPVLQACNCEKIQNNEEEEEFSQITSEKITKFIISSTERQSLENQIKVLAQVQNQVTSAKDNLSKILANIDMSSAVNYNIQQSKETTT